MNKAKMVELLSGKIDSLERWKAVCAEANIYWDEVVLGSWPENNCAFHYSTMRYINCASHAGFEKYWWLLRESYRQILGVYPQRTEVMDTVIAHCSWLVPHCIHISRDDPTMVAYTPSPEDGARDKQVRLSFGKLLRKLCILFTDEHIKQLEASHRSELDPTFSVARTPEEIQRVYMNMAGDSGCMRYAPAEWRLPDTVHPSHVYSYPGLGVAYVEFEGIIKSRSVIYDNPDDPSDKRYVRIYGDASLKRKLELAGYRCDNLQGAKLRAINLHKIEGVRELHARAGAEALQHLEQNPYLVPYLDGAGGSQGQDAGSYGYIVEGEDCIRLINQEQANRLAMAIGRQPPRLKSTGAKHSIPVVRVEQLRFTCAMSGEVCNSLETPSIYLWHEGQVKLVKLAYKPRLGTTAIHYMGTIDPGQPWDEGPRMRGTGVEKVLVHMPLDQRGTAAFYDSQFYNHWVLDTPQNRAIYGFVPLADNSAGAKWEKWSNAVQFDGVWYRKSECVTVFDAEGTETQMPQVQAEALRKANPKQYVAVAPKGQVKALSHVDNPRLVVTLGKRRCVKDWHPVVQLWDGSWEYSQNTRLAHIFGLDVYYSDKQASKVAEIRMTEDAMRHAFRHHIDAAATQRTNERRLNVMQSYLSTKLREGFQEQHFFAKGGALFRGTYWQDQATLDGMRQAAAMLKTMTDQQVIDTYDASMLPIARGWQHHAELLLKIGDEAMAPWQPQPHPMADADAVQLNELLTTTAVHIRGDRFAQAA